jgi:hypothetical protein
VEALIVRQNLLNFVGTCYSLTQMSLQLHREKLAPPGFPDQNKVVQIPVEETQGLETQRVLAALIL